MEPPIPLPYANLAPEKFRGMILYVSFHLPSNNYVSQQGAKMLPNTANIHTHIHTIHNWIKITRKKQAKEYAKELSKKNTFQKYRVKETMTLRKSDRNLS